MPGTWGMGARFGQILGGVHLDPPHKEDCREDRAQRLHELRVGAIFVSIVGNDRRRVP